MKRMLTALLFALGLTVLLALSVGAESGTATFYNGESVFTSATTDANGMLTLPQGPTGAKRFVGWSIAVGDLEALFPAGATVELPAGETIFRAVTVDLRTLTGAAVSMGSPTTLRFDGALGAADYQRLISLVGAENVTLGLLIAPATSVYGAQTDSAKFTHGCEAEGLIVRTSAPAYTTADYCVFSGRTDAIADDMLLESYAARAYLTVQTQEGAVTVYADYDPEKHDRMAHFVTAMAFEDRTESRKSDHIYTTADAPNHYALYPEQQLAQLEKRLDKVISVIGGWGQQVQIANEYAKNPVNYPVKTFTDFVFYTSPYQVKDVIADGPNYYISPTGRFDENQTGYETYIIVGVDGADFNNIKAYFVGNATRIPFAYEWQEDGLYISVRNTIG